MKIVIVGAGPAALKTMDAIETYRAVSREDVTSITIVSAELTAPYSPMFLVSYLTGELTAEEILLEEKHGLSPHRLLGEKVIRVEDSENKVVLESGREISYDRLLIASGSSAYCPAQALIFFFMEKGLPRLCLAMTVVFKGRVDFAGA